MSLIAGNLGIIQRLLDSINMSWGIYGGSAAHVYGNRRPIRNIDIVIPPGTLSTVSQTMKAAKRVVQFDGRRIMWSGINLCDDLSVRRNSKTYTIKLDEQMVDHLRRMPLLGSRVSMLAPEDVLIHKLLMDRGPEQQQKDTDDATSVAQRQLATLDRAYIAERLRLCKAEELLKPKLEELGITL
jgi:hypothetical protein